MYSLIVKYRQLNLPIDLQLGLFDAILLPVITYGCEVWGYKVLKAIQVVHLTFLKHILGVKKTTYIVYGELGKCPVNLHIKSRILSYWSMLINGKQGKISHIMYQCVLKLYDENTLKSPWLKCVKSLLDNAGMSGVWHEENRSNSVQLNLVFERNAKVQWITEWNATLRCSTYITYKNHFVLENYLVRLPEQERIFLCKFRTGNHRFPIVTGRYNRTPRENRLCTK